MFDCIAEITGLKSIIIKLCLIYFVSTSETLTGIILKDASWAAAANRPHVR
jgi:hypothetical protein